MRKAATQAALPKIELIKNGEAWEVHWDYQEAPESAVLFKRREYLDGYIHGSLDGIGIHPKNVSCASARTGTVKRLTEDQAVRFKDRLEHILIPVVAKEFERLKNLGDLPHMWLATGTEE